MPSREIQWFPGHMAKTRRLIKENLPYVDIVIELLDARIPHSSKNPEIEKLTINKPTLSLLNKASLADDRCTDAWRRIYTRNGNSALSVDCITGQGLSRIEDAIKDILSEKIQRDRAKGMTRPIRAMMLGIPNVGKSTLINKLCGSKKAAAEDRPGVTTSKQWVKTDIGFELLDMPGVLWPKFEDREIGEKLAATGAIKDSILIPEEIACSLLKRLVKYYPSFLKGRFALNDGDLEIFTELDEEADEYAENEAAYELFLRIGKKRGLLIRGGNVDEERCAAMILDEFRGGKIGKITLDIPE